MWKGIQTRYQAINAKIAFVNMKKEDPKDYKMLEVDVIMTEAEDPLFSPIKKNKCGRPRTSGSSIISQPKSIISQTLYAERKKNVEVKLGAGLVKEEKSTMPMLSPTIKVESSGKCDEFTVKLENNQYYENCTVNKEMHISNYLATKVKEEVQDEYEKKQEEKEIDRYTDCEDNISLSDCISLKSEIMTKQNSKKRLTKSHLKFTVKEPLKCTYEGCNYFTKFLSTLKVHIIKKHIGEKPISCDLCSYKCHHKGELRKHLITHSKESPYACDYPGCNYACKISSNLKKHKRIHTGERPYICDQCTFRSNFISSLKAHKRVHTNERPFCCECCGYRSNNASNLKKHFLQKHPNTPYILLKISSND